MKKFLLLITLLVAAFPLTMFADTYDKVALVSSSSSYDEDDIPIIKQEFGKKGYTISSQYLDQVVSDFGYSNTDRSRATLLVNALLDKDADILWFVHGGSGAINLIPDLYANQEILQKAKPKIIVGFSDITAIHYFVNNVLHWPSIHGVLAEFNKEVDAHYGDQVTGSKIIIDNGKLTLDANNNQAIINDHESIPSIKNIFTNGVHYNDLIPLNKLALQGAHGGLAGGNFTLVQAFFSTPYESDFSGKILLLEDVNVTYKQLDRSLQQLLHKKDLNANAIVFGQFYSITPTDEERLIFKTVLAKFAEKINKPVYYFPFFGHGRVNKPFILTQEASIHCSQNSDYCTFDQTGGQLLRKVKK